MPFGPAVPTGCSLVLLVTCLQVDQIYHLACPASPVHYK